MGGDQGGGGNITLDPFQRASQSTIEYRIIEKSFQINVLLTNVLGIGYHRRVKRS